ncbi:hypothetical protein HKD37_20G057710 [Glycine soja]
MLLGKLYTIQTQQLFETIRRKSTPIVYEELDVVSINIQQNCGELAHHSSLTMVKRDKMEEMQKYLCERSYYNN